MKIECLIRREGVTPVLYETTRYEFQPIYDYYEDGSIVPGPTTSVCEVQKQDHIDRFLRQGKYGGENGVAKPSEYREFQPHPRVPKIPETNMYAGMSYERHLNGTDAAGYIIRDAKRKQFGGVNGWGDRNTRTPFLTQIEAYEWLKAEVEDLSAGDDPSEVFKDKVPVGDGDKADVGGFKCPKCDNPAYSSEVNLKRHMSAAHPE